MHNPLQFPASAQWSNHTFSHRLGRGGMRLGRFTTFQTSLREAEEGGSQPPAGTVPLLHPRRRGYLPAGPGRRGGLSRRHYRPTGQRARRPGSETRPRTPLVRARPGLTASPLNRTDTRAGSDPPSSRRAASIAGASTVTSRCHLHGSEAEEPARPKR